MLRDTTERPEGIAVGTCVKVGTQVETIVRTAVELLTSEAACNRMARATNPYGDGRAAERIKGAIAYVVTGEGPRPSEFHPNIGGFDATVRSGRMISPTWLTYFGSGQHGYENTMRRSTNRILHSEGRRNLP